MRAHRQGSCIYCIVLEMYVRCRIEECGHRGGGKMVKEEERDMPAARSPSQEQGRHDQTQQETPALIRRYASFLVLVHEHGCTPRSSYIQASPTRVGGEEVERRSGTCDGLTIARPSWPRRVLPPPSVNWCGRRLGLVVGLCGVSGEEEGNVECQARERRKKKARGG